MVSAIHQYESVTGIPVPLSSWTHLPPHLVPLCFPRALNSGVLLYTSNLHWPSLLHMVIYIFSMLFFIILPSPSLTESTKVCSLHLCLLGYPACRMISTIFLNSIYIFTNIGFLGNSNSKESASHAGDMGLIPWSGRYPGEGHGNPFQYSCLKTPRTEEPVGLELIGSQRVGHSWATQTHTDMH